MTIPKNQNSILVLATLGVYLGLILAGATPQVLAQAAMTRQFDVKDEVEVKDDLDNQPAESDSADAQVTTDVTTSVERFLEDFRPLPALGSLWSPPEIVAPIDLPVPCNGHTTYRQEHVPELDCLLNISSLPRAGLNSLLANDAK